MNNFRTYEDKYKTLHIVSKGSNLTYCGILTTQLRIVEYVKHTLPTGNYCTRCHASYSKDIIKKEQI